MRDLTLFFIFLTFLFFYFPLLFSLKFSKKQKHMDILILIYRLAINVKYLPLIIEILPFNSLCAVDHLVNNAGAINIRKFEDTIDIANFKSLMVIVQ